MRRASFFLGIFGIIIGLMILGRVAAQTVRPSISFEGESGSGSGINSVHGDNAASGNQYRWYGNCPDGLTGTPPNCSTSGTWNPNTTLPPGSSLPSDAICASRVSPRAEVRPQNTTANGTPGQQKNLSGTYKSRITGNYTGTTDNILQWAACKWGIDVDVVRAQAAKESYWLMSGKGDYTTNPDVCAPGHPLGADGVPGQCPESYGILQIRYQYHGPPADLATWPEAETSTAYNADYTYAVWRECFEGTYGWLNTVERGETYVSGDMWGCVGVWFSGRWKTTPANTYIQDVQNYKDTRIWESSSFINFR